MQQQQQQGMVGSHGMMTNQAGMVNAGGCDGPTFHSVIVSLWVLPMLLLNALDKVTLLS